MFMSKSKTHILRMIQKTYQIKLDFLMVHWDMPKPFSISNIRNMPDHILLCFLTVCILIFLSVLTLLKSSYIGLINHLDIDRLRLQHDQIYQRAIVGSWKINKLFKDSYIYIYQNWTLRHTKCRYQECHVAIQHEKR
jgi:hypothetical protein